MTLGAHWNDALAAYVMVQRAAGRSPGTVKLHRHYLRNLAELAPRPWPVEVATLLLFLSDQRWAPETRKSARGSVRSFYRWAHQAGHVEVDPSADLPSVRVPPALPRPAPERVVAELVAGDHRVALMAMLAAYGGLRCAEIARVHSADLVGDVLTVYGKGGKVRAVPILHPRLLILVQRVEGWAFPNGQGGHLTPGHVSRLLSRAMPDGWTAHTLRHRMATAAYHGTRDLLAVGAVLGHSRPETTQRYVLMPDDALRAAVHAAS